MNFSYPERYFGGNQLLGCSMSLSPLYSTLTSDLHVSTVRRSSIKVSFDFYHVKYRSQPFGSCHLCSRSLQTTHCYLCRAPTRKADIVHVKYFHFANRNVSVSLAQVANSLVRVSRRDVKQVCLFVTIPMAGLCDFQYSSRPY